ncbi:hypothetical protein [Corynebacterium ulcerans]|uniref:hypothetical protein n=1 Tax=Corynebacterium ulcerans TaxID=65058 RepID=UPI0018D6528A|nr:hypothetical protein [Corynebacterium ulcerans]MBH5303471.1 hypothetical protein [Corynebacterium ulcerans]
MDEKTMQLLQKLSRDFESEKEKLNDSPMASALLDFAKDSVDSFMIGDRSVSDLMVSTSMYGVRVAQIVGIIEQQLYALDRRVAAIESGN